MQGENRVVIKLEPKPDTAVGWLKKAKTVCATAGQNVGATGLLASIASLLTQVVTDTTNLDGLQAKAPKGAPADTAARNVGWGALKKSLRAFVRGAQGLCDAAVDVDHAKAIVAAAGLDDKVVPVRVTPPLRAKALGNSAVRLYARRPVARRSGAFFEWQMSTDGKTYTAVAITNSATTTVQGLTPATTVYFRARSTFKNVTSGWYETSCIVH
jgi:hypothetical protein